ncbi:MAG: M20/M25/M40 family metallo-hydrolase [Gemmatimonadales bacterium]
MSRTICRCPLWLAALLTPALLQAQRPATIAEAQRVLEPLVESYGVSRREGPVREEVLRQLPAWARPVVDTAGNLWVRAGSGDPLVIFVAHMDEIGFRVTGIRDDGQLLLAAEGGFFASLFEAEPALVHTGHGMVPGVLTPRDSGATRRAPGELRVDVGSGSRAATEALGIAPGATVTMPKEFVRLAGTRATGRSFDDRVGCAALLLALRRIDPLKLRHAVAFVWSVREEIGLEGASVAADALGLSAGRVHAIDTFVSSDAPLDPGNYAHAALGQGPVIRAYDNSYAAPPALVDSLRALATTARVPLQYGTTSGGNDGSEFAAWGVPNVAIGWPLRYAHSPAETIDLRDVVHLAEVVLLIVERW